MFCRSLFFLFLLAIVLSDSDYLFGIFKLFFFPTYGVYKLFFDSFLMCYTHSPLNP